MTDTTSIALDARPIAANLEEIFTAITQAVQKKMGYTQHELAATVVGAVRAAGWTLIPADARMAGQYLHNGALAMGFEGGMAQAMAESYAALFIENGAVNFLELELTSAVPEVAEMTVTIQRKLGRSPGELLEEMRADADHNAPWLSSAHMLCTDEGIAPGHISHRIESLREICERSRASRHAELTA